jgi:hypothetical protein
MKIDLVTRFFDIDGNQLGNAVGILPIPLCKGMTITIHGHSGSFSVVEWSYHHGHPDEDNGLTIVLKQN